MKQLVNTLMRLLLVGVILPLIILYTVYYRFTPNYLPGIYSEQGFKAMYNESVFKYRVAGVKLQLYIYEQLKRHDAGSLLKENKAYSKRLLALDPNADPLFYASYFIINTLCSILTALIFLMIFNFKGLYTMSESEKNITTCALVLMIGITQFVVTPYDNLSYAMIALSFFLFLVHENTKSILTSVLLATGIIAATLVRESSLIILCMMLSVYILQTGFDIKVLLKKMWLPGLAFIVAYCGIRLYISGSTEVAAGIKFDENVNIFRSTSIIIAVLFAVLIIYLMWEYARMGNLKLFKIFLVIASPYFVLILFVGLLIEFRLWMPFVIGTLLLCKLDIDKLIPNNKERALVPTK